VSVDESSSDWPSNDKDVSTASQFAIGFGAVVTVTVGFGCSGAGRSDVLVALEGAVEGFEHTTAVSMLDRLLHHCHAEQARQISPTG
jgi:hypothetical protein